jgi:hypothetical protein
MNLDKREIDLEIKMLSKMKKVIQSQDFLDFIGKKCLQVLDHITLRQGAASKYGNMSSEYAKSHEYTTEIGTDSSIITLSNSATNQFGEYISAYIEYGTGVYYDGAGKKSGWWYPTDEKDKNTTKKKTEKGELIAFTFGQDAKNVYYYSLKDIEAHMNEWVDEYMKGVGIK